MKEKMNILSVRLETLAKIKWNKMSAIDKRLQKSFSNYFDRFLNKFISDVMKDESILDMLNELVDRSQFPTEK